MCVQVYKYIYIYNFPCFKRILFSLNLKHRPGYDISTSKCLWKSLDSLSYGKMNTICQLCITIRISLYCFFVRLNKKFFNVFTYKFTSEKTFTSFHSDETCIDRNECLPLVKGYMPDDKRRHIFLNKMNDLPILNAYC